MTSLVHISDDLLYPSSDGNPMAENTIQYRWIVMIKENLEILFAAAVDVFVAGDLLWYPLQVNEPPAPRQAPDVMVVFGVPKGDRRSYKQWQENNIPPQVVFEILSDSNRTSEGRRKLQEKFEFYQRYGVEEYYCYDPDTFILQGWQRQGNQLLPIRNIGQWTSPRLGIRFAWQRGQELVLYYPDGRKFLTSLELAQQAEQAQQQAEQAQQQAEQAQQQAEQAQRQAEQAQQQAEQARLQAALAEQQAEQARLRAEEEAQARRSAIPRLLQLGLSYDQIALALDLPLAEVQSLAQS
ncbi:MAG: Uma2 family endonuclease [Cyanobacteria bacterium]|nr:Uma2 family endonuclease [Cyanobacteriota bacterium]MDW8201277.1 Uma2 family endonuclease [Cyanobacteriota bacterium SKYGB_h_bin112]